MLDLEKNPPSNGKQETPETFQLSEWGMNMLRAEDEDKTQESLEWGRKMWEKMKKEGKL